MHPIPTPLADGGPDPADCLSDGRCWFGHGDAINPDTQLWTEATWTLRHEPGPRDTHYIPVGLLPVPAPDLSALSQREHPSLSVADRNPSLVAL